MNKVEKFFVKNQKQVIPEKNILTNELDELLYLLPSKSAARLSQDELPIFNYTKTNNCYVNERGRGNSAGRYALKDYST